VAAASDPPRPASLTATTGPTCTSTASVAAASDVLTQTERPPHGDANAAPLATPPPKEDPPADSPTTSHSLPRPTDPGTNDGATDANINEEGNNHAGDGNDDHPAPTIGGLAVPAVASVSEAAQCMHHISRADADRMIEHDASGGRKEPTPASQQHTFLDLLRDRSIKFVAAHPHEADALRNMEGLFLPDLAVRSCCGCPTRFTLMNRRHHCRLCGLLFCKYCTKTRRPLPSAFNQGTGNRRVCTICATASVTALNVLTPVDVHSVVTLRHGGTAAGGTGDATGGASARSEHLRFFDLPVTASVADLKSAYHSRLRQLHPDKGSSCDSNGSLEEVKQHFQQAKAWLGRASDSVAALSSQTSGGGGGSKRDNFASAPKAVNAADSACTICLRRFSTFVPRHHCRKCGQSVCGPCSPDKRQLTEYGFDGLVRHCSVCISDPQRFLLADQQALRLTDRICPAGQEYLSNMTVVLRLTPSSDDRHVDITCSFEPNRVSTGGALDGVSSADVDPMLCTYQNVVRRRVADFQWLRKCLIKAGHSEKRLPPLQTEKHAAPLLRRAFAAVVHSKAKTQHARAEAAAARAQVVLTFLASLTVHPMFKDNQWVWAFLALSPDQLQKLQKLPHTQSNLVPLCDDTRDVIDACGSAHSVQHWMQFLIERGVVTANVQELARRNGTLALRKRQADDREQAQKHREWWRSEATRAHAHRGVLSMQRCERCQEQTAREKKRLLDQQQTPKLVYIHRCDDVAAFSVMSSERGANRCEFTDACDTHSAQVQTCAAETADNEQSDRECCADNRNWMPPLHSWMLGNYNFVPKVPSDDSPAPRLIAALERDRNELFDGVPRFLSAADVQKIAIDLERERLAAEKATALNATAVLITTETQRWSMEDAAFQNCAGIRAQEQALRSEKEAVVTRDLENRERCLSSRVQRQGERLIHQVARRHARAQRQEQHVSRSAACTAASVKLDALTRSTASRTAAATIMLQRQQRQQALLKFPRDQEVTERRIDHSTAVQCSQLLRGQHNETSTDLDSSCASSDDTGEERTARDAESVANDVGNLRTQHESQDRPLYEDSFHVDVFERRQAIDKGLLAERQRLQDEEQDLLRERQDLAEEQNQLQVELQSVSAVTAITERLIGNIDNEETLFSHEQRLLAEKRSALMQNIDSAVTVQQQRTARANELRQSLCTVIDDMSAWHRQGQQFHGASSDRTRSAAAAADEVEQIKATYFRHLSAQKKTGHRLFFAADAVPSMDHALHVEASLGDECRGYSNAAGEVASQFANCKSWMNGQARQQYDQLWAGADTHDAAMHGWDSYEASVAALATELRVFHDNDFVDGVRQQVVEYQQQQAELVRLLDKVQDLRSRADEVATTCNETLTHLGRCLTSEREQLTRLEQNLSEAKQACEESQDFRAAREQRMVDALNDVQGTANQVADMVNRAQMAIASAEYSAPDGNALSEAAAALDEAKTLIRLVDCGYNSRDAHVALGTAERIRDDCPFDSLRQGAHDSALQTVERYNEELKAMQRQMATALQSSWGMRIARETVHHEDEWLKGFDHNQQRVHQHLESVIDGVGAALKECEAVHRRITHHADLLASYEGLVCETRRQVTAKVAYLESTLRRRLQEEGATYQ
jgi:hypothetical protein